MSSPKTLYFVHCVDTEGPLYESLAAKFECLERSFGLRFKPSAQRLAELQQGRGLPDDLREQVMEFLAPGRRNYKEDWTQVDEMVDELMSPEWRQRHADDAGNGYVFSWFVVDHVGHDFNPRRRALGFHTIYDHYVEKLAAFAPPMDKLYFHYHPVSYFHAANKNSNSFSYTNHHLQALSRRVIDNLDFPAAFRPGFHLERPDINFFLEQWIPFDYGNQGMPEREEDRKQRDIGGGRYGDWRRAPDLWDVYHPSFADYQRPGGMKRYIARCLNLDSRLRPISEAEIERAFVQASTRGSAILSITNHDEREMRPQIDWFMDTVRAVGSRHRDVRFLHANAVDAIRQHCRLPRVEPVSLSFRWNDNTLEIEADKPIWGPQPYFCFKTHDQRYIHENFDFQGEQGWSFTFDDDTIPTSCLEGIGVATNDDFGNTVVFRLSPDKDLDKTRHRVLNAPCFPVAG